MSAKKRYVSSLSEPERQIQEMAQDYSGLVDAPKTDPEIGHNWPRARVRAADTKIKVRVSIRHYGLFAKSQRDHNLARARQLLNMPAPQPEPYHPTDGGRHLARAFSRCLLSGTLLRNEIEARDAGKLEAATDYAASAIADRHGSGEVAAKIQAHVILAVV